MEHLYAPWRTEYFVSKPNGCPFCEISKSSNDTEHFVFFRDDVCFAVMNLYPYTPAHFMIIPHMHTDKLEDLPAQHWVRMASLAQKGVLMLKSEFGVHGVNIGMNLGECAGAGVAEHIHLHLVPRYCKDTNFITTIAGARVYGTDFHQIYQKMLDVVPRYLV